ncbi:maleylpyruvate isomerase family mycothiol-dependent enzyme [Streptomyces sp. MUM 203J]|uniref:maleylpyruvate isomerase family mycothiol-dependent enzyme n=1 Tax=Streptomyces sp. MUM 203J TaxID=2791990 RepID=UPI001F04E2A8|nr:maleylpyruvate isomerase family mycothiol-dependent enzyme [Streptomyces sp. MUM 203J]MCH0542531.1 maleylpyruvate isomerase family mycothiol-dependent enzyme [Streptomyces sp. MUM 203J]
MVITYERYLDHISRQVAQLRAVLASGADLAARVPTCPDWTVEQLIRHTGGALRWSGHITRTRAQERPPNEEIPDADGPGHEGDREALDAWLAEAGESLVAALREAGSGTGVWTWGWDRSTDFWARRMTMEVAVHRADAALAAGLPYEVEPGIAADAVDEWLQIVRYAQRMRPDDGMAELRAAPGGPVRTLHLHATDTPSGLDAEWFIELTEDGVAWRRGHEKADAALRGPLTEVLLAIYRRRPLDSGLVEVLGDRELLEFWLKRASF